LKLLAGPANAGKVALLLDRYRADLAREPVLIVPNRGDVDRVQRDLLARGGALIGGTIDTFDGVFELIANGNGGRRPVVTDAQRALLLRRVVRTATPSRLGRSAQFGGFADTLAVTIAARNDDICAIVAECPEPLRPGSTDSGGMIEIHH